jgi:hypothetical protein
MSEYKASEESSAANNAFRGQSVHVSRLIRANNLKNKKNIKTNFHDCRSRWCNSYSACHWTQFSRGSNAAESDGFLMAIEIRTTIFFGDGCGNKTMSPMYVMLNIP